MAGERAGVHWAGGERTAPLPGTLGLKAHGGGFAREKLSFLFSLQVLSLGAGCLGPQVSAISWTGRHQHQLLF